MAVLEGENVHIRDFRLKNRHPSTKGDGGGSAPVLITPLHILTTHRHG